MVAHCNSTIQCVSIGPFGSTAVLLMPNQSDFSDPQLIFVGEYDHLAMKRCGVGNDMPNGRDALGPYAHGESYYIYQACILPIDIVKRDLFISASSEWPPQSANHIYPIRESSRYDSYRSRRLSFTDFSSGLNRYSMIRRCPVLISTVTAMPGERWAGLPCTSIVARSMLMRPR